MRNGDTRHLAGHLKHIIARADIVGAGVVKKVGVVDKAGDLKSGKALHLLLELYNLLWALGHGAEHIDNVVHLKLTRLKRRKIGMIATERHCARCVAADIEDA